MNHTKGPWTAIIRSTDRGVYGYVGEQDNFSSDGVLATVECPDEKGEANARLIAAAPEMLEALEWVMGHVTRCTSKDSMTDEFGLGKIKVPYGTGTVVDAKMILDKLENAIKKAKGKL